MAAKRSRTASGSARALPAGAAASTTSGAGTPPSTAAASASTSEYRCSMPSTATSPSAANVCGCPFEAGGETSVHSTANIESRRVRRTASSWPASTVRITSRSTVSTRFPAESVATRLSASSSQRRRAGAMDAHAAPEERQGRSSRLRAVDPVDEAGVECRVEQRRVDVEARGLVGVLVVESHFGVELLASARHRVETLERRSVVEAEHVGELVVEAVDRDSLAPGRRPRRRRHRVLDRRRERRARVRGPRRLLVVLASLRPRVDRERPAAVLGSGAERQLELDRSLLLEHERRLEGELLDDLAAGLGPRRQGELDEGGAGHEHGVEHGVVAEPRLARERQPPGEEPPVSVGQLERRPEQRVLGRVEPGGGGVAPGLRREPVALALEGVGGELGAAGTAAREESVPVDVDAGAVGLAEELGEGLPVAAAGAQRRRDNDLVGPVAEAAARQPAQHCVRAELEEAGDALILERADPGGEAHRGAHVADPVVGAGELIGDRAGHVRDDRDPRRGVAEPLRHRPELGQHRLHQRRVEGVADA